MGICFGHQVLAQALGGRVERASGWGAGVRAVSTLDGTAPACASTSCTRTRWWSSRPAATVVGSAEHCPVAVLAVGERMLGIQAHPEFTDAYSAALLADRELRIGTEATAEAAATLGGTTDDGTAARWIGRFLAQRSWKASPCRLAAPARTPGGPWWTSASDSCTRRSRSRSSSPTTPTSTP